MDFFEIGRSLAFFGLIFCFHDSESRTLSVDIITSRRPIKASLPGVRVGVHVHRHPNYLRYTSWHYYKQLATGFM
jgi:hypothetical protein